jgi:predicted nucleic acid-binding protein
VRPRRPVVIDNTVLSNLAQIGQSELVWVIWGEAVCTTLPVQEEYAGVAQSGAVGVLTRGIQRGHLSRDEANGLLQALIAAGYYAPVAELGVDDEAGSETTD